MKANMLKVLIDIKKSGVEVFLTEQGIKELERLIKEIEIEDQVEAVENVG